MPSAAEMEVARDRMELQRYIEDNQVEKVVQEMLQALLATRPADPRQWMLAALEKDLSNESEDLSESELQRLFAVTRRITSEIVPQVTIDIVVSETLKLLNCDRVSLFVYDKKMDKLRLYASNLASPIMVSPGQGIAGTVFNQKETVNIPDCYQDPRFDKSFDVKTGYVTRSLMAVPIIDFEGATAGVIQAINKMPGGERSGNIGALTAQGAAEGMHADSSLKEPVGARAVQFERNDEKILVHLTQHVAIAMRNADVYREAISTSERSMGLLNTIQSLSQDLGTQSMLLTITMHATKIVSAVRATVFLADEANEQLWSVSTDTGAEIRIPWRAGIAGQCYCEGKVINIPDAYADPRFNQEIDKRTGFRTQSILAIPMTDDDAANLPDRIKVGGGGPRRSLKAANPNLLLDVAEEAHKEPRAPPTRKVIGVIQMINKVSYDGQLEIFDDSDIQVMELFAKFVGPKLAMSSMLSRKAETSDKKEGELALGKLGDMDDKGERLRKRMSAAGALIPLGEDDEEESEEALRAEEPGA